MLMLIGVSCKKAKEVVVPKDPAANVKDYREKFVGVYKGSLLKRKFYNFAATLDTTINDLLFTVAYSIGDSAKYENREAVIEVLPAIQIIITDRKGDTIEDPGYKHNWGIDEAGNLTFFYEKYDGVSSYRNEGGFKNNDSLVFDHKSGWSHVGYLFYIRAKK